MVTMVVFLTLMLTTLMLPDTAMGTEIRMRALA
jgi:hypothetical protein